MLQLTRPVKQKHLLMYNIKRILPQSRQAVVSWPVDQWLTATSLHLDDSTTHKSYNVIKCSYCISTHLESLFAVHCKTNAGDLDV